MSAALVIVVDGEPVPKARARASIRYKRDGTPYIHEHTPPETEAYEKRIKALAQIQVNLTRWPHGSKEAVQKQKRRFRVLVHVFRTHEGAGGDADNLAKSALDGCNKVAFWDDKYVRELAIVVRQDRARPRMRIEVVALGT